VFRLKHRIARLENLVKRLLANGPAPSPRALKTQQDVIQLLQDQVHAVEADPLSGPVQKAQAIGVLAGIARKAIEANDTTARLEILDAILRQRRVQSKLERQTSPYAEE
jgi:hypothetical protein